MQRISPSPIARGIVERNREGYISHDYMPRGATIESAKHAFEVLNV